MFANNLNKGNSVDLRRRLKSSLIRLLKLTQTPRWLDSWDSLLVEARQSDFVRGDHVHLTQGCLIQGGKHVSIGSRSYLGPNSQLNAINGFIGGAHLSGTIVIGEHFWATGELQILSATNVSIGNNVMIASNVFICDYSHGYSNGSLPYIDQPFEKLSPIAIGSGTWIGQNSMINPGVKIGHQAIIGANSVVTRDIPDYCIAVGAPARTIKRYDQQFKQWITLPDTDTP